MVDSSNDIVCSTCKFISPLFKSLNQDELSYFREISYEVTFLPGEIIFKQGSPLTHIICICHGSTKLYMEVLDGRNLILRLLLPTDIAGVSGINTDYKHNFSLSALELTTTCFIEVSAFKKVIQKNPAFANDMIGYLNYSHKRLHNKLMNLTQKNIKGKVADTLLYLANQVYYNNKFATLLSRQELADMSVTTRESTIRILKEFKGNKIIDFREKHFEILQKQLLEKISKFG